MKKIKLVIFEALFIILSLLISQQAFALKCVDGPLKKDRFDVSSANTKHVSEPKTIKIIKSKDSGVVLWQADYTVQLTCYDDAEQNKSENVFMWFDDADQDGRLVKATKNTNVVIGIIYKGEETYIDGKQERNKNMGVIGIKANKDETTRKSNCYLIKKKSSNCADPQTISLSYSLLIKSKPTNSNLDNLSGNDTYQVFQIDGEKARNNTGNFTESIRFGDIVYIDCLPDVFTNTVDLGVFPRSSPQNVTLGRKNFNITIGLFGEECLNETFKLRWIPSGKINDSTIKTNIDKVGIQIFAAGEENPYEYGADKSGNKVLFKPTTENSISKDFEAGVIFVTDPKDEEPPKTGNFRGSATFVLTVN